MIRAQIRYRLSDVQTGKINELLSNLAAAVYLTNMFFSVI